MAAIRRSVIDGQQLPVRVSLPPEGRNRTIDDREPIMDQRDDREKHQSWPEIVESGDFSQTPFYLSAFVDLPNHSAFVKN